MSHDYYQNPLISRYSSREMAKIWGDQRKFSTWRRLWVALAESEKELGLDIREDQIAELKAHLDDIDFEVAAKHEKERRHDVMAHVETYKEVCPNAGPIIHLGATSCFVTDNTDLILIREALQLIANRVATVIDRLAKFAAEYRDLACLGFTHFQPAQPTTIGKRACLWCYDLVLDLEEIEHRLEQLKARGAKGTTGTQASFLELFGGDHEKVRQLDELVAKKLNFASRFPVTGQTYPRKVDAQLLGTLSGVAQTAHKMATDLRLLQSRKEVEEPYETNQIGSSAMAYKRNPMRAERICGLARYVMSLESSAANTAAVQWMERTLDDSSNRRLIIPQAFLGIDAVLLFYQNVLSGLTVYPKMIAKYLQMELPFMATENVMMAAVKVGGDRQDLHERIRVHSNAAGAVIKNQGGENDLIERIANDEAFSKVDVRALMELDFSKFVGRAPEQVDEFIAEVVQPIREKYQANLTEDPELKV